jgi:hypothetical protein
MGLAGYRTNFGRIRDVLGDEDENLEGSGLKSFEGYHLIGGSGLELLALVDDDPGGCRPGDARGRGTDRGVERGSRR